ncbi:MAG: circadian clock KaiB family protein [Burkholderiales bacterium]
MNAVADQMRELAPGVYPDGTQWELRLYVAGQSTRSLAAMANLRRICDRYLPGSATIEIIDLVAEPHRAEADQILAIPTVVRRQPPPPRKVYGDLSDEASTLVGLEVRRWL